MTSSSSFFCSSSSLPLPSSSTQATGGGTGSSGNSNHNYSLHLLSTIAACTSDWLPYELAHVIVSYTRGPILIHICRPYWGLVSRGISARDPVWNDTRMVIMTLELPITAPSAASTLTNTTAAVLPWTVSYFDCALPSTSYTMYNEQMLFIANRYDRDDDDIDEHMASLSLDIVDYYHENGLSPPSSSSSTSTGIATASSLAFLS
jgi:hypothetical protein